MSKEDSSSKTLAPSHTSRIQGRFILIGPQTGRIGNLTVRPMEQQTSYPSNTK